MVEHRDLSGDDLEAFAAALETVTDGLDRLEWVDLNEYARRVTFAFERGAYTRQELAAVVAEAERMAGVEDARFSDALRHTPGDLEPATHLVAELGADLVGLAIGLILSLAPVAAHGVAVNLAAILSLVRHVPRLRQGLDERLGRDRATFVLDLAVALAQGLAQRPVSSLVDLGHKASLLRENQALRHVWEAREAELCVPGAPWPAQQVGDRPAPLPEGPIEAHVDRAWAISLGGFALSLLTTRNVHRAAAALFGALPKPAHLGREVYAAELGRVLAGRGTLVLDPEILRLLDRLDCLVIQGDLVLTRRYGLGEVVTTSELDREEAEERIEGFFDVDRVLEVRGSGRWAFGPVGMLAAEMSAELEPAARRAADAGALHLGLVQDGLVVALADLRVIPQTGAEELIAAAHDANMHVVVAAPGGSMDDAALEGLNADEVIADGDGLRGGVRRLQREGRVVCFVGTGTSSGLPAADCGVALHRQGDAPPWGAHVICREDLSDVRFLLRACVAARKVSAQSVNLALGAATMAGLASAGGLVSMTPSRAMLVVNAASLVSMLNGARTSRRVRREALPPPRDPTPWHALTATGALSRLGSSERGLAKREAKRRDEPKRKRSAAIVELGEAITDELWNPLTPLLAAGAGLSALVGSSADAGVVAGAVGLNALVGGLQRFRAARAIQTLSRSTRRKVQVRRDDRIQELDTSHLVRGDVVLLGPGDVVPADCRVIVGASVEVDASSLTGESLPVQKSEAPSFELQLADRTSMLYEGTSIAAGTATAVVVAVGEATEARRGADVARADAAQGGVERRLRSLMRLTAPVALVAGVGVIGGGMLRGRRLEDLVGSGVSLAVAAVPEGLPLLATAAQLSAAERLSRRGVLVRNPRSIEALGRVDVICLDKTGTLTEGRIDLHSVHDGAAHERASELSINTRAVLAAALRASPVEASADDVRADPTDEALLRGASAISVVVDADRAGWARSTELPFEAGRGYHAVLGSTVRSVLVSAKGAPEVILSACSRCNGEEGVIPLDDAGRRRLAAEAVTLGGHGLRVLAVAEREVDSPSEVDLAALEGMIFRGFVAFSDPVRPSAAGVLEGLGRAGVSVVMLTGDHASTAEAIASELGMPCAGGTLTGGDLAHMSDDELDQRVQGICVFARVTPSQKVRVVRALQRAGRVVAMAGDGANDAPAIRLANVGLAIGERSTTAARDAADVVVTDERIETIVRAIVEGRAMWASVRDAVSILIGGNLGEIGFTLAAGLIDGRPPLHARQLLLVNLLTDVAPAMAIALHPPARSVISALANEGPEASLGSPLNKDIAVRAATTALGAGTAWLAGRLTGSRSRARTIGLAGLVGTQLGQTLMSGGSSVPVIATSVGSALALFGVIQTPVLSHFFGCRPLGPVGWATAVGSTAFATWAGHTLVTRVEGARDGSRPPRHVRRLPAPSG